MIHKGPPFPRAHQKAIQPPTSISKVSVRGGLGKQARSMRAMAAVQLPWQSKMAEMMPPLMMPGKAQYFLSKVTVASSPPGTLPKQHRK